MEIDGIKEQVMPSPFLSSYQKSSLLAFVFLTNKLESTLPRGYRDSETYKLLEEAIMTEQPLSLEFEYGPQLQNWPAEGGGTPEQVRQQLLQFGLATKYLYKPLKEPLTVEAVQTAHKIMMWGAVQDGHPLDAGRFRVTAAQSGTGYVYPPAELLPGCRPDVPVRDTAPVL